jgi:hypothetical protein
MDLIGIDHQGRQTWLQTQENINRLGKSFLQQSVQSLLQTVDFESFKLRLAFTRHREELPD